MESLGAPVQFAYAVDDLDTAVERWAELGAGPFFVRRHIELARAETRGASVVFDHSSAYGQWGAVMVELVELHEAPASVRRLGHGMHHAAFFVDDLVAAASALGARGWPEVLQATTTGGTVFSFHDATSDLGHLVELYEPTTALRGFYAKVAAAAVDWDGTAPLREQ